MIIDRYVFHEYQDKGTALYDNIEKRYLTDSEHSLLIMEFDLHIETIKHLIN